MDFASIKLEFQSNAHTKSAVNALQSKKGFAFANHVQTIPALPREDDTYEKEDRQSKANGLYLG